jgi:hypothetical protein
MMWRRAVVCIKCWNKFSIEEQAALRAIAHRDGIGAAARQAIAVLKSGERLSL